MFDFIKNLLGGNAINYKELVKNGAQIIDVRSPAEFEEDHVPGAINCPVLSNEERIRVGTLYKQVSPFDAKKVGAALVAKKAMSIILR